MCEKNCIIAPQKLVFMQTAVCILNWNGVALLQHYLPTVVAHSQLDKVAIYVIDNASTDESVSFIRQNYPQIGIVQLPENLGFTGGYNEGLRHIEADIFVLLNSDVAVTPHWLEPLIHAIQYNDRLFAVQPKIKADKQRSHFEYAGAAGGFIDRWGYVYCRGRFFDQTEFDRGQYNNALSVFWASGACMVVRAQTYFQLGGLDASFFAHFEEIDLCWRAKRAGYEIWCIPTSTVYHLGGGSLPYGNPRKLYLNFRNNLVMLFKNLPIAQLFSTLPLRLLLDMVAATKSLLMGKTQDTQMILRAAWHFLTHLPQNYSLRQTAKKQVQRTQLHNIPYIHAGWYDGSIIWDYFVKKKRIAPLPHSALSNPNMHESYNIPPVQLLDDALNNENG